MSTADKPAPDAGADPARLLSDLVPPGERALLVIPGGQEAPWEGLMRPHILAIRDLLDGRAMVLAVQEADLERALPPGTPPPALVVTEAQAFRRVAALVPRSIPMTSFSILLSRIQGGLSEQVRGALAIDRLRPGDRVLVSEACTHHPKGEDTGRSQVPQWLVRYTGMDLDFVHVQGPALPRDLGPYRLVIHCGNCSGSRIQMEARIRQCQEAGVPITNFGLAVAYSMGIFERALESFPRALNLFREATHPLPSAQD